MPEHDLRKKRQKRWSEKAEIELLEDLLEDNVLWLKRCYLCDDCDNKYPEMVWLI